MKLYTKKILIVALLFLLVAGCVPQPQTPEALLAVIGNTLYVNQSIGNDLWNCTSTQPCKTFPRAQTLAVNGDTIRFAGVYTSQVTVTKSGLTLDGGNETTIDTTSQNCIDIRPGVLDTTVRNFKVTKCRSHAIHIEGNSALVENNEVYLAVLENGTINADGKSMTCGNGRWGSGIKTSYDVTDVIIRNNPVHDICGESIGVTLSSSVQVLNNLVYGNAKNVGIYVDNSFNVLVDGNSVTCGVSNGSGVATGEESYSGYGARLRDIEIRNNIISGCWAGINLLQSDVGGTLTNVSVHDNILPNGSSYGIAINASSCSNVSIANNKIWTLYMWTRCSSGITKTGNVLYTPVTGTPATFTPIPATLTRTPTLPVTATRTPSVVPPTATMTATPSRTPTRTPIVTPSVCLTSYPVYVGPDYIGDFCP